ncbi:hypothetical protein [Paenibacillus pini]|nr:hypothetical protein [Paenibacillus pini]
MKKNYILVLLVLLMTLAIGCNNGKSKSEDLFVDGNTKKIVGTITKK